MVQIKLLIKMITSCSRISLFRESSTGERQSR